MTTLSNASDRSPKVLRRISCHGRNYSQPYVFKRNQSSDNRSHGFGAKFLLKKLSASDFSYERKSAFRVVSSRANHSYQDHKVDDWQCSFVSFFKTLHSKIPLKLIKEITLSAFPHRPIRVKKTQGNRWKFVTKQSLISVNFHGLRDNH